MMGQFEQLDQMLTEQEGMLRTSQVVSSGISKPVFYDYVRSRDLDRVAHGIYLSKDSWVDAMYLLHLRFEQAVFSHETALFFHDLTDREPNRIYSYGQNWMQSKQNESRRHSSFYD